MSDTKAQNNKLLSASNETPQRGLSLKNACAALGCSESHGWKMIRTGQLKSVSFGRRRIVPVSEIERVLQGGAA
jgi:excisionase family DNA binding protein